MPFPTAPTSASSEESKPIAVPIVPFLLAKPVFVAFLLRLKVRKYSFLDRQRIGHLYDTCEWMVDERH